MKNKGCASLEFLEHCPLLKRINVKTPEISLTFKRSVCLHKSFCTNLFACYVLKASFWTIIIIPGTIYLFIYFIAEHFFFYWEINWNCFNLIRPLVKCLAIWNICAVFTGEEKALLHSVTSKMHCWKEIPNVAFKKMWYRKPDCCIVLFYSVQCIMKKIYSQPNTNIK